MQSGSLHGALARRRAEQFSLSRAATWPLAKPGKTETVTVAGCQQRFLFAGQKRVSRNLRCHGTPRRRQALPAVQPATPAAPCRSSTSPVPCTAPPEGSPGRPPRQGLNSPRGSYSLGLSQDHRQGPLAAGPTAEVTRDPRQVGPGRGAGGGRSARSRPWRSRHRRSAHSRSVSHHVAWYIPLCNQPSFRQPRNIRLLGTPSWSCLAVHASPRIGHSAPGIWDLGSLIEGLAHGHGARAAPTRLGR